MIIPKTKPFLDELKALLDMHNSDPERAEKVAAIYMRHLLEPLTATREFNISHFGRLLDETRIKVMAHMIRLPSSVTFKVPSLNHQLKSALTGSNWYYKEVDNNWFLISTHPDFPGSDTH